MKKIQLKPKTLYEPEVRMLLTAIEERIEKVQNDEVLWDAWELSALSYFTEQLNRILTIE